MALNMETWRSQIPGRQGVWFIGEDGKRTLELISGGQEFVLSPDERRMTQAKCRKGQDPFTNGVFALVKADPDADDAEEIQKAADVALSDADIEELAQTHVATLRKKISEISSLVTLRRIEGGFNQAEATPGRMKIVRDRMGELGATAVVGVKPASDHPAQLAGDGIDGNPPPKMATGTPDAPMSTGMPTPVGA